MRAFADLLDRLSLTASRNAKLTLVRDYLARHARPRPGLGAGGPDRRPVASTPPSRP